MALLVVSLNLNPTARTGVVAQVAEHLPRNCKALSSNPIHQKITE
jgi:hypothetical protein